jgi:hypothetical protein
MTTAATATCPSVVCREHRLHLGGRDVLAAPDDAVRAAVGDQKPAVGVQAAQVTGPERLAGDPGRLAEVAQERRWPGHDDLADLVGIGILDGQRHARHRPAGARGCGRRLLDRERGHARAQLREPVAGNDGPPRRDGAPDKRAGDRAAAEEDRPEIRRRRRVAHSLEQAGQLRGHQRDVRHLGILQR